MNNFHNVSADYLNIICCSSREDNAVLFRRMSVKFTLANRHIWFNKECLKNKVTPRYVSLNTNNKSNIAINTLSKARVYWIKAELKKWYNTRDTLSKYLYYLRLKLTTQYAWEEFVLIEQDILDYVWKIAQERTICQKKKLERLKQASVNADCKTRTNTKQLPNKFYERVLNLSKTKLDFREEELLKKGLKYCPVTKSGIKQLKDLACDTHVALKGSISPEVNSYFCKELKSITRNQIHVTNEMATVRRLQEKIEKEDIIIVKADKGNTTVLMDRTDYLRKTEEFLSCPQFGKLSVDPTLKFQKEVNSILDKCTAIVKPSSKYKYVIMNPTAPKFKGLPKIHKENIPIRPVVSNINAPSYKLAKLLNIELKSFLKFTPRYTVKNSLELIEKIKDVTCPISSKLVSFDVCNLFTNIPVQQCLDVVRKMVHKSGRTIQEKIEICDLLETCIKQNYFIHNGQIYEQLDGLAMGSSLSPLLADVFMDFIEEEIFSEVIITKNVIYWYRYVDDILVLWSGTKRQLTQFFDFINNIHTKIKFTLELGDKEINFLDLNIKIADNKHIFKIHRKDTFSDCIINAKSNHTVSQKHSALYSMLYRYHNVPMTALDKKEELDTIKTIASENGFESTTVTKILNNIQKVNTSRKLTSLERITESEAKWVALPYYGKMSERLGKKLKKEGFQKLGFKSKNSLKDLLCKTFDKIAVENKSGVYQLTCNTCNKVYIGQTGRKFKERIKEHIREWNKKGNKSTFAAHLIDNNHHFDPDLNVKYLHISEKGEKLNILEKLEIVKAQRSGLCLNEYTDFRLSPILSLFL